MSKKFSLKKIRERFRARRARPNKLYFYETVLADGKKQYGWRLLASNGRIIGSTSELYSKKIYAIKNVITLFGIEILDEIHVIEDEASRAQVLLEMRKQNLYVSES